MPLPPRQSRYLNIKSVLDPAKVVGEIFDMFGRDGVAVLWATHDETGKVRHTHYVVRFDSVRRWGAFFDWLESPDNDPHAYCASARSFVRSVRYLLHLDNPEKEPIPFSALLYDGIDESEVSIMLGGKSSPILESLQECRGMQPVDMFQFLVSVRGHKPSEVSSAIRCLLDLKRLSEVSGSLLGVMAQPVFQEEDSDFDEFEPFFESP